MTTRPDVSLNEMHPGDEVVVHFRHNGDKASLRGFYGHAGPFEQDVSVAGIELRTLSIDRVELISPALGPEPPVGSLVECDGCGESFARINRWQWIRMGEWPPNPHTWREVNTANGCRGQIEIVSTP